MKKIAYIISAYTEPQALANLISALQDESVDFYIHIDRKVNIAPFKDFVGFPNNVYWVPDDKRIKVYWGGYSQVNMQLEMLAMVFENSCTYERIVSLTGTDYPFYSNQKIIELMSDKSKEYIIGFDVMHEEGVGVEQKYPNLVKFTYFHYLDSPRLIHGFFERIRLKRFIKPDRPMYYGSEYWGLTYECAKSIYISYREDISLQRLLKHSFAPSEAWVHTLFFNSEYASKSVAPLLTKEDGLTVLSPLTFFYYHNNVKPLTMDYFDQIVESKRPFIRKAIPGISDELLKKINQLRSE